MQLRSGRIVTVLRDPQDENARTLRVTVSEPEDDGDTPLAKRDGNDDAKNMFRLEVEEPCIGENGAVIGWLRDESITVKEEQNPFGDAICEWTATWPKTKGKRRLVIREFQIFRIGDQVRDREEFSCVLEV